MIRIRIRLPAPLVAAPSALAQENAQLRLELAALRTGLAVLRLYVGHARTAINIDTLLAMIDRAGAIPAPPAKPPDPHERNAPHA